MVVSGTYKIQSRKKVDAEREMQKDQRLFQFIELVMPRTRIAEGFRSIGNLGAFVRIQFLIEADLAVPAFELIDIVSVYRIFYVKLRAAAGRTFRLCHF